MTVPKAALRGPRWIGIGAPRSGTTLFTQLVAEHPDVALSTRGRKELHYFDPYSMDAFGEEDAERYRSMFDPARCSGEFTPAYLRSLWVPPLVLRTCGKDVVLVVLVRDPVERYRSHVNWLLRRGGGPDEPGEAARRQWALLVGNLALWAGMYATQLDAWSRSFARDRFVVLQYERFVKDPAAAMAPFWERLGLTPRAVAIPSEPTWNSTGGTLWKEPEGTADRLRSAYEGEVARLAAEWGIDRSLWRNFS